MPVTLSDLVKDPPLLLAACEHLVPFMNGSAMRRLTFLLDQLAFDSDGDQLDEADRRWLEDALCHGEPNRDWWEGELSRLRDAGVELITSTDGRYPINLKLVHDGPPLLFVQGRLEAEDHRAVAVVGTREASRAGLDLAQNVTEGLVARGYTVVSGLAKGYRHCCPRVIIKCRRTNYCCIWYADRQDLSRREPRSGSTDHRPGRLRVAVPSPGAYRTLVVPGAQPHRFWIGTCHRRGGSVREFGSPAPGPGHTQARQASLSRGIACHISAVGPADAVGVAEHHGGMRLRPNCGGARARFGSRRQRCLRMTKLNPKRYLERLESGG